MPAGIKNPWFILLFNENTLSVSITDVVIGSVFTSDRYSIKFEKNKSIYEKIGANIKYVSETVITPTAPKNIFLLIISNPVNLSNLIFSFKNLHKIPQSVPINIDAIKDVYAEKMEIASPHTAPVNAPDSPPIFLPA